jgi:hypothetical protein
MASLNAKSTIANFLKKGFIKSNSHHHYYEFWYEDKLIAKTYSSHNNEPINDYLIGSMRRQCNMDKPFFIEFAKCTKSKEDYILLLKKEGLI